MNLFFIFVVGVSLGIILGRWWGRRLEEGRWFDDDSATQALRFEAVAAVRERIKKRKDRIMEVAQREGRVTNDDVEDLYCIADRTASSYLNQLVKEGRLIKRGAGRGTYYTPIVDGV